MVPKSTITPSFGLLREYESTKCYEYRVMMMMNERDLLDHVCNAHYLLIYSVIFFNLNVLFHLYLFIEHVIA